jgi:branched-subunit amino acid transport protein
MPKAVERALRFVPVAVLTAIFLPELVYVQEDLVVSYRNPRLIAGLLAIVVAWRTKNVMYTIVIGMLTLWFLQYIFN